MMARSGLLLLLLALYGAALCRRAGATAFEVGGDHGWAVPSSREGGVYNQWASNNRFLVGDIVRFRYTKDSVMVVTEGDYNDCHASRPIFFSNNGDTAVTLDRPGLFYFISGVAGHCERGQRMIVKVMGADAPPPSPSPSGAAPAGSASVLAGAVVAAAAVIVLGV